MILQSVVVPDSKQYTELYYRGSLTLSAGETLTFDTFYNSFSYTKYRQYTIVQELCFSCDIAGEANVQLCVFDGQERVICGGEFSGKAELFLRLSDLPEKGFLYPKITAKTGCKFLNGEYRTNCEQRNISCCIAICTYKRENYVIRNTSVLRNYKFSNIDRVFVVDNGNTLDCKALSDDFIRVVPNRNFGGSGGFTRGLIEALDGGYSHVILMDDDVEFFPETLEQMTVFVSLLKDICCNNWFSAGMLPIDCPNSQFELGAEWDGKKAVVHKHNVNIVDQNVILDNLCNPGVAYGGWWTLLMPVSVIQNGLPYPFFIKFDDVEYGLRKSANAEIITMNGIAVKHEEFDRKKNFVLDYYNLRNELVVNAIYDKYGRCGAVRRFCYEIAKDICLYRYDIIPIAICAVNNFLEGVDFFLKCDEEDLNRDLISKVPAMTPLKNITQWSEDLRCDEHDLDKRITPIMLITFGGHLIPSFMLKNKPLAVPLSRTGASDCFGKRSVIQYQLGGESGIVTKRSEKKFVVYMVKALGVVFRLFFGYNRAQKSFQSRKEEISSLDFWRKHLGLNKRDE